MNLVDEKAEKEKSVEDISKLNEYKEKSDEVEKLEVDK